MKDMKRFISLFLVAVMAIGIFSCKKDPEVNMERIRIHENEKQFSTDGETISMSLSGSVSNLKSIFKMTLWLGSKQDLSDAIGYDVHIQDTTFNLEVDDLKADTVYYYRYGVYRFSVEFNKEMEIHEMQTNEVSTHNLRYVPKVETGEVSQITRTSAVVTGAVINEGGATIIEKGICWSVDSIPTIADNRIPSETGDASFSISIAGLSAETSYYVRAYAINQVGVGYGVEKNFTTLAQSQDFTVSVSANPSNGGIVSGSGTYQQGQSCTVTATANTGFSFSSWTENGIQVSTNTNYTITVNSNRTLVANFYQQSTWPNGVLPGMFSVSATQQVHFSQGNLQYQASSNTWRFAINQYDFTGSENSNISQTYSGWIDLFGWGTSGYNHGAVCYQPWSTNTNESNYYAYGSNVAELWYQSGQADWGYNAICNGGNHEAQWHTLSKGAWEYIFTKRNTASGIRYARGNVNGTNGILLFPDDWEESLYPIVNYNTSSGNWSHFNDNTISLSDWEQLEINGVVFLPLAGFRSGTDVDLSKGMYWSSSNWGYGTMSYCVCFDNSQLDPNSSNTGLTMRNKSLGLSVRLVRDAE